MPTPTILITGATDGIGLAMARLYAERGVRLILVGRRPLAALDDPLFSEATYCRADLSQLDCHERVRSWLAVHDVDRLDALIHNAGLGYVGSLAGQTAADIDELLHVNLYAPVLLTHTLLPHVERASGKVAFVSSVVSTLPAPNFAIYAATKAALDGFARNLQIELRAMKSPATAHVLHPGATRTAMFKKSGAPHLAKSRYPSAEKTAHQLIDALDRSGRTATIGGANKLLHAAGRHLPALFDFAARRQAQAAHGVFALKNSGDARHVVITGAADGIGKALAREFAALGDVITGVDVDAMRADATQAQLLQSGADATFIVANLGDEGALDNVAQQLAQRPPIDVLIHNAGISDVGPFVHADLDRQRAVLDVNLRAPLVLTTNLLRQGRLRKGTTLVFLSSLSHYASYPGAAVYAASKDGLASYARSLSSALASDGVHVLTVFPGPTRTAHARRYSPDSSRENRRMAPADLARRIGDAVEKEQRVLIPGLGNRVFAAASRLAPGPIEQIMRRTLFDKLHDGK